MLWSDSLLLLLQDSSSSGEERDGKLDFRVSREENSTVTTSKGCQVRKHRKFMNYRTRLERITNVRNYGAQIERRPQPELARIRESSMCPSHCAHWLFVLRIELPRSFRCRTTSPPPWPRAAIEVCNSYGNFQYVQLAELLAQSRKP